MLIPLIEQSSYREPPEYKQSKTQAHSETKKTKNKTPKNQHPAEKPNAHSLDFNNFQPARERSVEGSSLMQL